MRLAATLALLISTVSLQLQAQQIVIEAEMKPPVVIHKTEPAYTEDARNAKVEGAVTLWAEIRTDGKPYAIRVTKGLGYGLNQSAIKCLSEWRYRPGTANGIPVTVPATMEIFFSLNPK
jgi:periplasmic protein TonB